jgi:hypothetical protein
MSVYVVSQNDFATAVFKTMEGATAFVDRQAKRTIGGQPIYWTINKFEVGE